MKFKESNQIFSSLKISQSINTESSTCDRNNKRMYSWFYESKKLLGKKKKTEDGENVLFKDLAKSFFVGMKKLFMVKLLSNALHEKVICYIIKLLKVD